MSDDDEALTRKTHVVAESTNDEWIQRLRSAVATLHGASALANEEWDRDRLRFAARVISTILGDEPPPRGAPAELALLRVGKSGPGAGS
jgi:hypothetical protein